jgi:hypothetical protein
MKYESPFFLPLLTILKKPTWGHCVLPFRRRAISRVLTEAIIVIIVIAAVAAFYVLTSGVLTNMSRAYNADVKVATVTVDADGSGYILLTIRNTGTATLQIHRVSITGKENFTAWFLDDPPNRAPAFCTTRAGDVPGTFGDPRCYGGSPIAGQRGTLYKSTDSAGIDGTGDASNSFMSNLILPPGATVSLEWILPASTSQPFSNVFDPGTTYRGNIYAGAEIVSFKIVPGISGGSSEHTTSTTTTETTSNSTSSSQTETRYTITFHTDPTSGTISADGVGKANGATGTYLEGQRVHVVANPPTGYSFTSWEISGGASVDNATAVSTYMTVSNTGGLKAHFTANHYTITITSNPAGTGFVKVDDASIVTPQTFSWTVGSTHKLEALSPVSGDAGTQYLWQSWSDSGSRSHLYTTPASTQTVTATYKKQYQLTMQVNPSGAGTVTPSAGTHWYDSGVSVAISATKNPDYTFSSWSGSGTGSYTGTQNPSSLTMNGPITENANFQHTTQVTITSDPTGSEFVNVDGTPIPTPQTFTWAINSTHTLAAASSIGCDTGCQRIWTSWSDGGAQSHTITVPSEAITYTANFKTQYYLTVASSHDSPNPVSGWLDEGYSVSASVSSPVSGGTGIRYSCTGWTGTGSVPASGIGPSATFTIDAPSTITWNWNTQYQLTMQVSPTDGGTTTPAVGSYWYEENTPLTIMATSNPDHQFLDWTGTAYSGPDPSAPITMNSPIVETAEFADVATTTQVVTTTGTTTETSYETTTTTSYSTTTSTSTIYETTTTTETVSSAPPAPAEISPLTCIGYVSLLVIATGHLRVKKKTAIGDETPVPSGCRETQSIDESRSGLKQITHK